VDDATEEQLAEQAAHIVKIAASRKAYEMRTLAAFSAKYGAPEPSTV
jgi:hypothetical protein